MKVITCSLIISNVCRYVRRYYPTEVSIIQDFTKLSATVYSIRYRTFSVRSSCTAFCNRWHRTIDLSNTPIGRRKAACITSITNFYKSFDAQLVVEPPYDSSRRRHGIRIQGVVEPVRRKATKPLTLCHPLNSVNIITGIFFATCIRHTDSLHSRNLLTIDNASSCSAYTYSR